MLGAKNEENPGCHGQTVLFGYDHGGFYFKSGLKSTKKHVFPPIWYPFLKVFRPQRPYIGFFIEAQKGGESWEAKNEE